MKKVGDYAGVSRAHLEVADNYSKPYLIGPPVCDELISLIEHMFTEEEAEVVRHLKPYRPRTAAKLAEASGMPLEHVKPILDRLDTEKQVIGSLGEGEKKKYIILPVVPGTFEMVMIRTDTDSVTPWHERFAELFEALYATGYLRDYLRKPVEPVRYLPVGEVIESQPMAYPSDRLEDILDRYDDFALSLCQCRLVKDLSGEGCGKMLETCTIVGDWAHVLVEKGMSKTASKRDIIEVKRAAEKEGLVTWMVNEESGRFTSCLCSCCGCCCAALRTITELNCPGFIARPHFMPGIDQKDCVYCEKCVKVCPMGALEVVGEGKSRRLIHKPERCIGCGLCVVACDNGAMTLEEVPEYRKPPGGWTSYLGRYIPTYASTVLKTLSARRRGAR